LTAIAVTSENVTQIGVTFSESHRHGVDLGVPIGMSSGTIVPLERWNNCSRAFSK
jgi:hypothetical protein